MSAVFPDGKKVLICQPQFTVLTTSLQAEVLGAGAAVVQLLEVSFRLIKRVTEACDRQGSFTEVLEHHALEIESLHAIVRTIKNEEALQTAVVGVELDKVGVIGRKLVQCLRDLDPGSKGKARQIAHQLLHGTKEEETLSDIMVDLDRAKFNLSLRLQLATVGLTRMVHDTVLANVEVVNRIDRLLSEVTGGTHGLKLASLIQEERPQSRGLVRLNKTEIASMTWEATKEYNATAVLDNETIERIIVGNTAKDCAVQLLGPVGKDMWEDIRVRIENNKASDHGVQIVYPTDFATFKYLLDHRERMSALESR
ncbi:hypothetical protein DL98DRAFT_623151 [Cadophora sp. DSE1049]|nr:hypothetical protein DL98DRAFT_623151 [Cadophora sp. DSE1049]